MYKRQAQGAAGAQGATGSTGAQGALATINNNTNNYVVTATGTANTIQGESDLQFDGAHLTQAVLADGEGFNQIASGNHYIDNVWNANRNSAGNAIGRLTGQWNGNEVASIKYIAGADTTNKDDAHITFFTATSGSSNAERVRIDSNGRIIQNYDALPSVSSNLPYAYFAPTKQNYGGVDLTMNLHDDASNALGNGGGIGFSANGSTGSPVVRGAIRGNVEATNSTAGYLTLHTRDAGGNTTEKLRISSDGKVGINENAPENQLHIAGTTGNSAGGLLRLDATTGDNFIIFDNTGDNSEWVIGNDSGSNDEFRMYYNSGSGYGTEIVNIDGTTNNGKVTIDGGTTTLVQIRADSGGTAGLRLGGQAGSGTDQCTGFVEVHQDESHGGGMFYNGCLLYTSPSPRD